MRNPVLILERKQLFDAHILETWPVAGIDLFLHPTFLLILLPGMTGGLSAFFIVALFGCVVLHELGHALMARRFGIETLDITLYPIGGVARLQRMPRAPGAELLIALAGPAVNFAIVAGLLGLELLGIGGMESDSSLGAFLAGLMLVNLILGLFNLIPAFPMDGGRVLRALLSGWLGRVRATSIAATIGRALAVAFGVYSLLHLNLFHVALAAFIYFVAAPRSPACWPRSKNVPITLRKARGSGLRRQAITGCNRAMVSGNWPRLS